MGKKSKTVQKGKGEKKNYKHLAEELKLIYINNYMVSNSKKRLLVL